MIIRALIVVVALLVLSTLVVADENTDLVESVISDDYANSVLFSLRSIDGRSWDEVRKILKGGHHGITPEEIEIFEANECESSPGFFHRKCSRDREQTDFYNFIQHIETLGPEFDSAMQQLDSGGGCSKLVELAQRGVPEAEAMLGIAYAAKISDKGCFKGSNFQKAKEWLTKVTQRSIRDPVSQSALLLFSTFYAKGWLGPRNTKEAYKWYLVLMATFMETQHPIISDISKLILDIIQPYKRLSAADISEAEEFALAWWKKYH